jgi:hypothetical protein
MKAAAFYAALLLPVLGIPTAVVYLLIGTNLPQLLYLSSIRNIYFDCMQVVPDDYVFKMKPGECTFRNVEFDTILTHDRDGFRNRQLVDRYDVAALGSSHTHGFGVADDQTFASILQSEYGYVIRNLGMGAYATMRELEVLRRYDRDAPYVLIQYSHHDRIENAASLALGREQFRAQVEEQWMRRIVNYRAGKGRGYWKPAYDLIVMLGKGSFSSKASWRHSVMTRKLDGEAGAFAQIIARYRDALEGRRVIVFESSDSGRNSATFVAVFGRELDKVAWLTYKLIDATKILDFEDYYFLDDHLRPLGHRKLAAAIAEELRVWEKAEPRVRSRPR